MNSPVGVHALLVIDTTPIKESVPVMILFPREMLDCNPTYLMPCDRNYSCPAMLLAYSSYLAELNFKLVMCRCGHASGQPHSCELGFLL